MFINSPCSGQIVFVLVCSFQKPEFNQPQHYFKILRAIKQPDELLLDEEVMEQRLKKSTQMSDENRAFLMRLIAVRAFSA
jgi:acyl-CoA thioesterase